MVLTQKQKYRTMEQDRKPRNNPMDLWVPYFRQRQDNGAKTASSVNSTVKMGQVLVKE